LRGHRHAILICVYNLVLTIQVHTANSLFSPVKYILLCIEQYWPFVREVILAFSSLTVYKFLEMLQLLHNACARVIHLAVG
jgi:hypothetical protein